MVYIGIKAEPARNRDLVLAHWGWRSPASIYDGNYWALITSVFVHIDIWYLIFNLGWLYYLGRGLERNIGSWRWLAFFASAALVGSAVELAVLGNSGIGASGVCCAMFGFMWVTRKEVRSFARTLSTGTASVFLMWLVACVVLTISGFWRFGITAQVAGLCYGGTLGGWVLGRPSRLLMSPVIAVLVLAAVISLFWAPWSVSWTSWRAARAEERGDFPTAIRWYERSLDIRQDDVLCLFKLALLRGAMGDGPAYHEILGKPAQCGTSRGPPSGTDNQTIRG